MSHSNFNRQHEAELRSLINAVLEGTADQSDLIQLGQLLEQNPQFIQRYADHLVIDAQLSWDTPGNLAPFDAQGECEMVSVARPTKARPWGSWLAIAAALLVCVYYFAGMGPAGQEQAALAHVTSVNADVFTKLEKGDAVNAGVFRLAEGEAATLEFELGSQLYCEGPCELELVSQMLVSLVHGKVTADVPPPAIGFTVMTKRLQVTDLGTRFGVSVDPSDDVDVVVFDGEVNLSDRQGHVELPEGLYAGEALRVGEADHFERLVSIGHDPLSKSWTSSWQTDTTLPRSVFTKVTDNLDLDSEPNFYGIVPRGLVEDTRAYSDRVHEWNSLPGDPLPTWLRGADLIRRFNSRKYDHSSHLEVELTVSTDCVLYVIWDTRCEPLPWLKQRFKNTGYVLGMDEGPYIVDEFSVDVGPGKSIDTTYAVWSAKVHANEVTTLGILGNEQLGQYKNSY